MASLPILDSLSGGGVPISHGTAHGAWHRWSRVLRLICLLSALLLPTTARAALDIQAKTVKVESKEEIWVINWKARASDLRKIIELQNLGKIRTIYTMAMAEELKLDLISLKHSAEL